MAHFLNSCGEKVYFLLTERALPSGFLLYSRSTPVSSLAPKHAHPAERTGFCLLSGVDLHHVLCTGPWPGSVLSFPDA